MCIAAHYGVSRRRLRACRHSGRMIWTGEAGLRDRTCKAPCPAMLGAVTYPQPSDTKAHRSAAQHSDVNHCGYRSSNKSKKTVKTMSSESVASGGAARRNDAMRGNVWRSAVHRRSGGERPSRALFACEPPVPGSRLSVCYGSWRSCPGPLPGAGEERGNLSGHRFAGHSRHIAAKRCVAQRCAVVYRGSPDSPVALCLGIRNSRAPVRRPNRCASLYIAAHCLAP